MFVKVPLSETNICLSFSETEINKLNNLEHPVPFQITLTVLFPRNETFTSFKLHLT